MDKDQNPNRKPMYAVCCESLLHPGDLHWVVSRTKDIITFSQQGDIHLAQTFTEDEYCDAQDIEELLEFHIYIKFKGTCYGISRDFDAKLNEHLKPHIKIVDLNNAPLQQFEVKRLRWIRNIKELDRINANWNWADEDLSGDLVRDSHPSVHYHIKISTDDPEVFLEFWPTTNKWRDSVTDETHHGRAGLMSTIKMNGDYCNGG